MREFKNISGMSGVSVRCVIVITSSVLLFICQLCYVIVIGYILLHNCTHAGVRVWRQEQVVVNDDQGTSAGAPDEP